MGQKLHRGRRAVFKRRNPFLRIAGTCLVAAAIVATGFFGAKYLLNTAPSVSQPNNDEQTSATSATTTTTTAPAPGPVTTLTDGMRAFYLPTDALADSANLAGTLQSAAKAGFNAVVVEMKDNTGALYYQSATERAQQVGSFVEGALTGEQVGQLFAQIRQAGLRPIVRMYAFKDNAAARVLADARITPAGNSSWVWYDGKPGNGGQAWLNPYADAAHLYLIDLARELKAMGAQGILLDGVQFPAQTSGASFGSSSNVNMSRSEILTTFVDEMENLLGDTCPVILACTADSALGEKTQVYGGNPLTFHATAAAPIIGAQQDIATYVRQMATRIKVIEKEQQPLLAPLLQAESLDGHALKALLKACRDGGAASYILYAPSGAYDFAALL